MFGGDLTRKIRQMSEYLDEEAIAAALRIPVETVRGIIQDRVSIRETATEKETFLQIATNPVYRQRIISVWRGRGGAGCTSIALHLAYLLEQMMSVLLVDLGASGAGSDLGYYLHLPEYPNLEVISRDGRLSSAVIQVESGLWALLPPTTGTIDRTSGGTSCRRGQERLRCSDLRSSQYGRRIRPGGGSILECFSDGGEWASPGDEQGANQNKSFAEGGDARRQRLCM